MVSVRPCAGEREPKVSVAHENRIVITAMQTRGVSGRRTSGMRVFILVLTGLLLSAAVAGARTIVGTPGNDRLVGTPRADNLFGRAGNDRISGLAGADLVLGGAGRDSVDAGAGNDRSSRSSTTELATRRVAAPGRMLSPPISSTRSPATASSSVVDSPATRTPTRSPSTSPRSSPTASRSGARQSQPSRSAAGSTALLRTSAMRSRRTTVARGRTACSRGSRSRASRPARTPGPATRSSSTTRRTASGSSRHWQSTGKRPGWRSTARPTARRGAMRSPQPRRSLHRALLSTRTGSPATTLRRRLTTGAATSRTRTPPTKTCSPLDTRPMAGSRGLPRPTSARGRQWAYSRSSGLPASSSSSISGKCNRSRSRPRARRTAARRSPLQSGSRRSGRSPAGYETSACSLCPPPTSIPLGAYGLHGTTARGRAPLPTTSS